MAEKTKRSAFDALDQKAEEYRTDKRLKTVNDALDAAENVRKAEEKKKERVRKAATPSGGAS